MHAHTLSLSQALHEKALKAAASYFKAEAELIDVLQKIEAGKNFRILGYPSLFAYATLGLKLPENTAYSFILVARKSSQVPELKKEVVEGNLNISNARRIAPILTSENKKLWIEKAKNLSQKKLEQELAREFPKTATAEKVSYVTETRLNLSLGVSEQLMKKFKRAQDILSRKNAKSATLEDTLGEILNSYLERNDPVEKAKRIKEKEEKTTTQNESQNPISLSITKSIPNSLGARQVETRQKSNIVPKLRKPIPASVKHRVNLRDQGRCTYTEKTGKRCEEARWIHTHHIVAVSDGGSNDPSNLTTLCSFHHAQVHQLNLFVGGLDTSQRISPV